MGKEVGRLSSAGAAVGMRKVVSAPDEMCTCGSGVMA